MVPASITATIQLTSDGHFLADDSVNAVSGSYVRTTRGYRVISSGSTAVGYAGNDTSRLTVIAAIDAVTYGKTDVAAAYGTGTTLRLAVPGYALTFADDGPAATFPPPSSTATSS